MEPDAFFFWSSAILASRSPPLSRTLTLLRQEPLGRTWENQSTGALQSPNLEKLQYYILWAFVLFLADGADAMVAFFAFFIAVVTEA